jgi:hypothetical protein
MRISHVAAFVLAVVTPCLFGQKVEINLDRLKEKARAANEVNLEGPVLDAALKMGLQAMEQKGSKGKEDMIHQALAGVKGIYVRNYEFDNAGAYTDADVESILKQVRSNPGWSSIVSVKEKRERTEICLMSQGDQATGLLVLAAEPKELTVVNIVGSVAVAQMKELVNSKILEYVAAAGGDSKGH